MALRSLEKAMAQTKEIEMPELSWQMIKEKSKECTCLRYVLYKAESQLYSTGGHRKHGRYILQCNGEYTSEQFTEH